MLTLVCLLQSKSITFNKSLQNTFTFLAIPTMTVNKTQLHCSTSNNMNRRISTSIMGLTKSIRFQCKELGLKERLTKSTVMRISQFTLKMKRNWNICNTQLQLGRQCSLAISKKSRNEFFI